MAANDGASSPTANPNASVTSLGTALTAKTNSLQSQLRGTSTRRSVVTSPPWARNEPPSPTEQTLLSTSDLTRPRASDVGTSRTASPGPPPESANSLWQTFAHADGRPPPPPPPAATVNTQLQPPQMRNIGWALKERSKSWLTPANRRSQDGATETKPADAGNTVFPRPPRQNARGLTLELPPPQENLFTLHHNHTPGWASPWSARPHPLFPVGNGYEPSDHANSADETEVTGPNEKSTDWKSRRKRWRRFFLTNNYVPLLFRVINIAFTTAALAMAIRIRETEMHHHVMGAVGSSPTLVIIFAPLTLVHVMSAIYLEYLGRPLGLWRTSAKLAHTLFEVVFICAWSAALSLSFDNFFTSLIPCASPSRISWYNELNRPSNIPGLGRGHGGVGDNICDDQVILICLVGVGLIMYCINLVISLFRIFEKVKYHPAVSSRP
ncbi:hypothetical protein PUNSTDRAFT_80320 [Punctularia strigosozonata HHB-11173 SS5]|uniref:uncharacterized protein n=1 Tax=Punctularia strigosozonata (strain HHB-11173) TaxID=741275 RepID=UPI0004416BD9|nr:uncharacterized protein PUNSTDRAFT_80320 [Punctularia strigosozonata HHB-11173 SS5]EIN14179.1 hypothetical protein PUNSTDRAFT_80320 [Punctularia strigosozonata HHB-11173 SS5]